MEKKNYLICPDSFKESMTAEEAANAIYRGLIDASPDATAMMLPLADGGEGTAELLGAVLNGEAVECLACDALQQPSSAKYYIVDGNRAILDVAEVIGLGVNGVTAETNDIMAASSYGAGLIIVDAWQRGIRDFVIGLGGSATCDGGRGMYEAINGIVNPSACSITALCDVDNPLYGPEGAAYVFAPQKGASQEQVEILDKRLRDWNRRMKELGGRDVADMPGAGAAGGIGGMLASLYGAEIVGGACYVMDALGFDNALASAGTVITGEGRMDGQTARGKVVSSVLTRVHAKAPETLVYAFCGAVVNVDATGSGLAGVYAITPPEMPLNEALEPETAMRNMRKTVYEVFKGKR